MAVWTEAADGGRWRQCRPVEARAAPGALPEGQARSDGAPRAETAAVALRTPPLAHRAHHSRAHHTVNMKQIFAVCTCLAVVVAAVSATETTDPEGKEERLIGAIITSTTTLARLATTTITQPLTCLLGGPVSTVPCVGRRKRRHVSRRSMFPADAASSGAQPVQSLDSSLADPASDDTLRKGKILLFATRLVTSLTDFTTTFTSTDSSTTVSVSVLCTIAAIPVAESFRIC